MSKNSLIAKGESKIMFQPEERQTFKVSLAKTARQLADQFCQNQSHLQKAEQVYLNTLAVSAVHNYLQHQGFETDLAASDSQDVVMQTFLNVADLQIKHCGKLECRPVLPEAKTVYIPEEVFSERIGYVAVQLDQSLQEATLLGFTPEASQSELPLTKLRSLLELPAYLDNLRPIVRLNQWFGNALEAGWQSVETLLEPQPELACNFRSVSLARVERSKLIELGVPNKSVVMTVTVNKESEQKVDIYVEVNPTAAQACLPNNLKLMALDETGTAVTELHTQSDSKTIYLELVGQPGENFSIKLVLDDFSITENFVIDC
ncbi:MAG: DUF1822 family protein [Coleofasciculaceae cyanobacterium]